MQIFTAQNPDKHIFICSNRLVLLWQRFRLFWYSVKMGSVGTRHDTGTEVVTRSTVVSTVVSTALYNRIIFG